MTQPNFVRAQLSLPAEMNEQLEAIAWERGMPFNEVVRQALALYLCAHAYSRRGFNVGFAKADQPLDVEVVLL